ncbi:hypothetical protein [Nocardia sp. BMG51109]|nr:hypothetical protein [Nocardia sp. BMG51109]
MPDFAVGAAAPAGVAHARDLWTRATETPARSRAAREARRHRRAMMDE